MADTESRSTSMDDKYPPLPEEGADDPHPVTGLSPRQARAVLVSWDIVRPDMKKHGVEFFIMLFKTHPHIQKYFKGMDKLEEEQLRASKRLAAHAHTVMLNISGIVDNLDDVETLAIILEKIGASHKRRGIQADNFMQLKGVLMTFLEENLGDHFTETTKEGWDLALGAMVASITKVYEEEEEAEQEE